MSKSTIQLVFLICYALSVAYYIRSNTISNMMLAWNEGCEEAASKLEKDYHEKYLHTFCYLRKLYLVEFPPK